MIGGLTSILVTRPSARIQNRTSCFFLSSGGAPAGIVGTKRGVGPKISLALSPEPGPASAPVPVPVPVPVPPADPGPCPGPPVVPSPVPITAASGGITTRVGAGTLIFTRSVTGAIVGTVTAGACGAVSARAEDGVGSANQLTAGRPPPPPPPRGPVLPPPPRSNSA